MISNDSNIGKKSPKGGKEKMVSRSVSIEESVWSQAQKKAGFAPLSAIIRALLKKWLKGEIELMAEDTED